MRSTPCLKARVCLYGSGRRSNAVLSTERRAVASKPELALALAISTDSTGRIFLAPTLVLGAYLRGRGIASSTPGKPAEDSPLETPAHMSFGISDVERCGHAAAPPSTVARGTTSSSPSYKKLLTLC